MMLGDHRPEFFRDKPATAFRFVLVLLIGGVGLGGCQGRGTPPDVPVGRFEARIDGMLSDTLTGPAHYRADDRGIRGIELGAEGKGGLSIELEPLPPALRTYEVIETELFGVQRPDDPPGGRAFLSLDGAQFTAVEGTFELTYVGEEHVGARFTFVMERDTDRRSAESSSVEVHGRVNAPAER